MSFTPDDATAIATELRRLYVNAETLVLEQLAHAVAETADEPDHLVNRLNAQRRMVRHLDRILADLANGVPAAVGRVIALAQGAGIAGALKDLEAAGLPPGPVSGAISLSGALRGTAQEVALARAAVEPLSSMTMQIRRWALDTYAKAGLDTAGKVASGAITRREASRRLLLTLAKKGVTGFVDRGGRSWEMGAYAEMVGRTTAAQAAIEGHAAQVQAYGVDTVKVDDAIEECDQCRPFEGKVLSLSGAKAGETLSDGVRVYASLAEAKRRGLFHPNCRHSTSIYLPGHTKKPPPAEATRDEEGDALRQEQRKRERRIRELKRAAVVEEAFGGPRAAAAKKTLRDAQAEFKAWREEHDRKNLAYRTNLSSR